MKKLIILITALLFAVLCVCPACAMEGEYPWREWTVQVTGVDTNPMFVPVGMAEDEYAVAVNLSVEEDLWKNGDLCEEMYAAARLEDQEGNKYEPFARMTGTDKPFMIFTFCVPKAVDASTLSLVLGEGAAEETTGTGETDIPAEMAGKWQGTGTPKNGGTSIDLTVTINADGSGEYTFDQGGYHETNPFSISRDGNRFSVNTDDSILGECEGTWELADGILTLDITSLLPNGRTYSYTAECTKTE